MQLNLVDTKICGNCKIEKKFEEFNNCASRRFNLQFYCKICHRLKVKEYMALNKEKKENIKINITNLTKKKYININVIILIKEDKQMLYLNLKEIQEV